MRCLHSLLSATQVGSLLLIADPLDDADVVVYSGEVDGDVDGDDVNMVALLSFEIQKFDIPNICDHQCEEKGKKVRLRRCLVWLMATQVDGIMALK